MPSIPRLAGSRRSLAAAAAAALAIAGLAATTPTASAEPDAAPSSKAAADDKAVTAGRYIVTFADEPAASYEGGIAGYAPTRPAPGHKLDPTRGEVIRYRGRLAQIHDAALAAVGATKLYDYSVTNNGVAVELSSSQARKLSGAKDVVSLEKDALAKITTTYSPEFLGLGATGGAWSQLGGNTTAGRSIIVGVIDTGIWPESPSFAGGELKRDTAGHPVEATGLRGKWFGACVQGELFSSQNCNDKLIGARYYVSGFGKKNIAHEEYLSPRDGDGHGSHTASTAAGNRVPGVSIDGAPQGTASGMAPGARVAAYKICWTAAPGGDDGCFNTDSVAAINDAVADGVDVINYSVGGSTESSVLSAVEQAYRAAANSNVFVANSAGNSGPDASTLDHPSPWLTTVAASTFRISEKAIELGNGKRFVGASTTATLPVKPLVTSLSARTATASAHDAALCYPGSLDPVKTAGKLVQCDRGVIARIAKSFEVKRAGGAGMVLTNTSPNSLNGDFHAVPTVHVPDVARTAILAYIAAQGSSATGAITAVNPGESTTQVPEVAAFSSRGPSTTTGGDILKPDISAPGVDVVAAVAPPFHFGRSYDYLSGTSMASPHIAGLAALVRAKHPTWSPAAVKSALMTTTRDHVSTDDPFDQGAGFVQPNGALDPGLVFDAAAVDWRRYMVSLGVRFLPPNDTLTPLDGPDLNQASIAIGAMAGSRTVTRAVTNVSSSSESYTVSAGVPGLSIVATPSTFTLAAGASRTVSLAITYADGRLGQYAKGKITFQGSTHRVRIPVAVRPVAISAPREITGAVGSGSGSQQFNVTPGVTGTLTSSVTGLVGSTPTSDSVATGPFDLRAPSVGASTKSYTVVVSAAAGASVLRFDVDTTSNNDDLDLYVYKDGVFFDYSASADADEQVTVRNPVPGTYTAYVNGYETGSGGSYKYTSWVIGTVDAGNLTVSPSPTTVAQAAPTQLTAKWRGLDAGKRYLGWVGYSLDSAVAPDITIVSLQ